MDDEPQKRTIPCPRCEKPIDCNKRRLFDNLFNCVACDCYVQDGLGFHGVADMRVIDLPTGMCIIPHAVVAKDPLLKFMYFLLEEFPVGKIEKIMRTLESSPEKIGIPNNSMAAYVINVLARLGIKVL